MQRPAALPTPLLNFESVVQRLAKKRYLETPMQFLLGSTLQPVISKTGLHGVSRYVVLQLGGYGHPGLDRI